MNLIENCLGCRATLTVPKPEHLAICADCRELAAFGTVKNLCRWCLEPLTVWEVRAHDWCSRQN